MIALALAALALGGDPSVQPLPIGPGPRYVPAPAPAAVIAGRPVAGLRCTVAQSNRPRDFFRVHLELFADRRVVVVPAGIGVAEPFAKAGADVRPGGCSYPLRTLAPTGVVEVARGARLRLADLFRLWGQPLGPKRFASFRSGSPLRAYVGGRRISGPVADVQLTPNAQIVVELGSYVPPHRLFLFPREPA